VKLWKPALGVAIVAAIVVWNVGLPGRHSAPNHGAGVKSSASVAASPSAAPTIPVPDVAGIPGVIQPHGTPEFSAIFTGSSLDTSVWATCYPYSAYVFHSGCTNFGNANRENEWYTPSQVQIQNGTLNLVAVRQQTAGNAADGSPQAYSCRSGMVTTYPGFNFQYGYLQIVANIPDGQGLWPALWLAATNLQWPPEMDVLEAWGAGQDVNSAPYAATYFHFDTPTKHDAFIKAEISPATKALGWHTFALSWTPTQMTWLLDGHALLTTTQYIPHQKMFLVANLAEAVTPTQPNVLPGQCNGDMQIRSVAVWAP
jgi:beta-glucanase (GH16 family)